MDGKIWLALQGFWFAFATALAAAAGLYITMNSNWFDANDKFLKAERTLLQYEVTRLEDRKNAYETTIASYSNQVQALQGTVSNLEVSISVLQATNQFIQESLNSYNVVTNNLTLAQTNLLFLWTFCEQYFLKEILQTNVLAPLFSRTMQGGPPGRRDASAFIRRLDQVRQRIAAQLEAAQAAEVK
jgi:hypothetical protein